MSLILAIRANGKTYFMADRRVLAGAVIKRDQNKLFILSSKANGRDIDITVGLCGSVRFLTLLRDPRNQEKVIAAYKEAPTIYGLVDGLMSMFTENGTGAENDPGSQGSYNLRMAIGLGDELYEVTRDLIIDKVPSGELAAVGSGSIIATPFWAGAHGVAGHPGITRYVLPNGSDKYETRADASTVLLDDNYYRNQLQAVYDYVTRVDSGVGNVTDFYSYHMQVPA